ncbi:hypothetical protein KPH14_011442 [Odynerus spinipes]|uniref:Spermatogenesis-associated protein 6 N-terminal domain-containing protein n=1 Tax=Odynerus spinipes TaxID=1348599 RepID=A0AAD9RV76_9HYME|nr:hypothetical protein KPH14_011442 [Odynerus spinipes]
MKGRGFCVKIQLHLHAVTCPGVWLCPNGEIALQINTLNYNIESRRMMPVFPLLFHEKFTFEKMFARVVTLVELQQSLEQELFCAKLVQWITPNQKIILATFETSLVELLYPASCFKGLLAGIDVDLLMEPTKYFPGIIAPKIEISTKTIVEGIISIDNTMSGVHVINPKTISSKSTLCIHRERPPKGIIRQKRVCHSQGKLENQNCQLSQQKLSNVYDLHTHSKYPSCSQKIFKPLARYNDLHVFENCPVCLKYKCYFSNYNNITASTESCEAKCKKDLLNNNDISKYVPTLNNVYTAHTKLTEPMLGSREKVLQDINDSCSKLEQNQMKYFYKNLEKFYKRMYEQAKLHAEEMDA